MIVAIKSIILFWNVYHYVHLSSICFFKIAAKVGLSECCMQNAVTVSFFQWIKMNKFTCTVVKGDYTYTEKFFVITLYLLINKCINFCAWGITRDTQALSIQLFKFLAQPVEMQMVHVLSCTCGSNKFSTTNGLPFSLQTGWKRNCHSICTKKLLQYWYNWLQLKHLMQTCNWLAWKLILIWMRKRVFIKCSLNKNTCNKCQPWKPKRLISANPESPNT